ncbi:MAG: hypothetical protein M1840_006761 [Geoglossum simile]|nr:MAG: hypothetical protein M1840_006761 [Geoglossum simile]
MTAAQCTKRNRSTSLRLPTAVIAKIRTLRYRKVRYMVSRLACYYRLVRGASKNGLSITQPPMVISDFKMSFRSLENISFHKEKERQLRQDELEGELERNRREKNASTA